jgi:hypothetical protein
MPSDRTNGEGSPEESSSGGGLELGEFEEELSRLGGVLGVRVVGDRNGRPTEVHVLSDHSKPAKQTVRDVRAVAQTMFGLEIDHRIVSVAQLDATENHGLALATGVPASGTRVRVAGVRFDTDEWRATARVVLDGAGREHTGTAEGSIAAIGRPQLVAAAALDALRKLEPAAESIHLALADLKRMGKQRVALVTVIWIEPSFEIPISGSAIVQRDQDRAVVRALLDATNRRICRFPSAPAAR